jgi:hypothetical protein
MHPFLTLIYNGFIDSFYGRAEFPLVQVDVRNWNLDLMIELFLFDNLYRSEDHEFYEKHIYNKRFLDSNGQIFLAKDKGKD